MMDWFRSHHGAPSDPKWLVIARRAKVQPVLVVSVFWTLLDFASQQDNRGSIEGFDTESVAAFLGVDDDEVSAVLSALEDKGITASGRIANWEKRQVNRERSDNSTARVQRHRSKGNATANHVTPCNANVTPCNPQIRLEESRLDKIRVEDTEDHIPPYPQGGSEREDSDTVDAFTPEELQSEPLPRGESRKQQEAKKREADEKRTAIMAAFRSARFDRPATDPVPVGEFNRMKRAADELIECGATPEQVRAATDAAMLRFSTTAQVTLGAVSGNLTALLTPEVSRATSSRPMSGADAMRERMAAVHQRHADILRDELAELGYEGIP